MIRVAIKECATYAFDEIVAAIEGGVMSLGGWETIVRPGDTVLLKVNLIGPKQSETAAVTHREFIRALSRILKQRGCTVWIGDSAGGAIAGVSPTARAFKVSGIEQAAEEEGAIIKNFDKEGVVRVNPDGDETRPMYLAKPMFDADVVINLPKLKTHVAGIYTGAVKNLFGCIPGLKKAEYHKLYPAAHEFGTVIANIAKSVRVALHIMDGVEAMHGRGPTSGTVYPAKKILMSSDPLALDTVAVNMLGLDIKQLPIFDAVRERSGWCSDIASIEIVGDYSKPPLLKGFSIPKPYTVKKSASKALRMIIDFMKTRPVVNTKVCRKCNSCVDGCPMQIIDRETKRIDYSRCIECMCCHELCMYQAVELRRTNPIAGFILGKPKI